MQARTTLLGWLRGDRGEGSMIAVIGGTIVFLIASLAVAGTVTLGLAASTRAQANTQITQKVEAYVAKWRTTPYTSLTAVGSPTAPANITGQPFQGQQVIAKDAVTGAYHLTVAAVRNVGLNPVPAFDCTPVFTGGQDINCLVLTATISPSPFDVVPATPAGVTQTDVAVGRGVSIATLNLDPTKGPAVTDNDALDIRVNVNATAMGFTPANLVSGWRLTLTCDDQTPLAQTPDSQFTVNTYANVAKTVPEWVSARVTLTGIKNLLANGSIPATCQPKLRLFNAGPANPTQQPTVANTPTANVKIWRVAGVGQ